MNLLARLVGITVFVIATPLVWAEDMSVEQHHRSAKSGTKTEQSEPSCAVPHAEGLENVQIETSNIKLYEQFFEKVLQVPVIQRADHPGADALRGYCYRGVLVVVRQDLRTARPTGWVQLNFRVPDVAAVHAEIEQAYRMSSVSQLSEMDQGKIVRFRFKPEVMRGDRKVARFEVAGPEGFMIGFDQDK